MQEKLKAIFKKQDIVTIASGLAIVLILGYLGFFISTFGEQYLSHDGDDWNDFSSALGGFVGTVINGLTAILVYNTYKLQKEEVKKLSESAKEQSDYAAEQNFQGMFRLMMETHQLNQGKLISNQFESFCNYLFNDLKTVIDYISQDPPPTVTFFEPFNKEDIELILTLKKDQKYIILLHACTIFEISTIEGNNFIKDYTIDRTQTNKYNSAKRSIYSAKDHYNDHIKHIDLLKNYLNNLSLIITHCIEKETIYLEIVLNSIPKNQTDLIKLYTIINKPWQQIMFHKNTRVQEFFFNNKNRISIPIEQYYDYIWTQITNTNAIHRPIASIS